MQSSAEVYPYLPVFRSLCITVYCALEHQLLYNMKAFLLPRRDMMAIAKPPPSLCWELKRFLWKMWQQNCTHCNHACSCHSLVHRHRRPHRHHHPWASKIFRSSFGFPKQWLVGGYRWSNCTNRFWGRTGLGWHKLYVLIETTRDFLYEVLTCGLLLETSNWICRATIITTS